MKQKQSCLIPRGGRWHLFYIGTVLLLTGSYHNDVYAITTSAKLPAELVGSQSSSGVFNPLAQQMTVNGQVQNTEGEPLVGVSVTIKGIAVGGTSTEEDGRFSINVPRGAVLVFRHLGYLDQEMPVNSQQVLQVMMQAEAEHLEEVVVVGFGTQKKVNLTGSVATVKGEDLVRSPVTNVGSM